MGLEPEMIFGSTVLVFWAIAFIPWFLRERQWGYFASSWLLLFAVRLRLTWNPSEAFTEVVIAFGTMCLGTLGGIFMYLYEARRNNEQNDETTDNE